MTPRRAWRPAVLGAFALVIAIIGIGLILEHTVGPSWASGGHPIRAIATASGRLHPTAKRIPPNLRRQLVDGRRLGARYGGSDFSNFDGLRKAIVVQIGIGAIVVLLMIAWRRMCSRRKHLVRARARQLPDS